MRGFGTDDIGNFGEMVSSLGPAPSAPTILFNNLAPGLPQKFYEPKVLSQPLPAATVASGGASMPLPGVIPRDQYIEWQGQKLLLGKDVDAKQPWFEYAGVRQPNFLYKIQAGPVFPRPIRGPELEVPSGQPMPISKPLSPPLVPSTGEVVRTLPLPKESVKPYEAMQISPPNGNLVAVDSYDLAPAAASAPITEKKLPLWAWLALGYVGLKLMRSL